MIKNKLVAPTLQTLFIVMGEDDENEDDIEGESSEIKSPIGLAGGERILAKYIGETKKSNSKFKMHSSIKYSSI